MIPFVDLVRQHASIKTELMRAVEQIVDNGRFILGDEGAALERELAAVCGVAHGIGVGSGTDALRLALTAVGVSPGDEVITPAFSFVASSTTIVMAGATPVFVDIEPDTFALDPALVERAITPRTRAIVPVHLYGHPAPMDRIMALARAHRLAVVEDAAQAVGGSWQGRPVGAWGDAACLSFYPTKNLGACGDGGMVVTGQEEVATRLRRLRHHGDSGRYRHVELGTCSRLDEIQAAMLRVKLRRLEAWTETRRRIAARYRTVMAGLPLTLPVERPGARHVWHLFTVRHHQRDALAKALADLGVGTSVHYPIAVPDQPLFSATGRQWPEASRAAREVLSLPCFPEMSEGEIEEVGAAVRAACERIDG
ncbi:MAG: DegT/DnrJ/EryC1/StrS family aminotransferase [Candidatus Rokubacteria bacterium]|nr:DegT/DnrJ/EryC1/StrS family aminotransferase [Candidatus Rokubacteria bacterium]